MKYISKIIISFVLPLFILQGCMSQQSVKSNIDKNITVGTVQKEIKVGMPASAVVSALGSPNIVTSNDIGGETWVYDKISQDVSYSNNDAYGIFLLIGGSKNSGSSSTSQRTLTIIINLDDKSKVTTFKYHTSSF